MLKVQSHRTLANLQVNLLFYVHGYRFECATLAPSDLAQACTRCTTTCTTWSSEYTTPCPRWGAPFGLLPVGLEIGNILYNGWSTGAISLERTLHLKKKVTGWWFGTYILCFHILGMSWSQLTNSIFFQRGRWLNHQPGEPRWAGRWPPDDFPGFWRTLSTELLIMKRMNRREWSIFSATRKARMARQKSCANHGGCGSEFGAMISSRSWFSGQSYHVPIHPILSILSDTSGTWCETILFTFIYPLDPTGVRLTPPLNFVSLNVRVALDVRSTFQGWIDVTCWRCETPPFRHHQRLYN